MLPPPSITTPTPEFYLMFLPYDVIVSLSSFFERYIFRGNGTPPHLPEHVDAVTRSPMRLLTVIDDRNHCRLTTKQSAEGLDRRRADGERRRGTPSTGASRSTSGAASIGSAVTSCRRTVS